MYHFLSFLSGVLIAVMISVNGRLSLQYGALAAAVIVHIVGTLFSFILCLIQKKKILLKCQIPKWFYLGGAIGVLTTLFNNLSFGHISVTNIVALGLLGQTITSLIIDCSGAFGMEQHPFKKELLAGLSFSLAGIAVMMDFSDKAMLSAIIFSICAGVSVVLSRTVNARLSQHIGGMQGSFVNHFIGLLVCVALFMVMAKGLPFGDISKPSPSWAYFGGAFGVIVVFICNIIVPKVPAFRLTLLTFAGQVFAGFLADSISGNVLFDPSFYGGLLITFGVVMNLILEKYVAEKNQKTSGKTI